jgi:type IV pilus assembly protein PilA
MLRKLHREESGFTLVELMIVVVILGILVAIAVPIFNKVTGDAERRAWQSNVRTIEGILTMIAAGNDAAVDAININTTGMCSILSGSSFNIAGTGTDAYIRTWPKVGTLEFSVVSGVVYPTTFP